jgi:predicted RNase H-like nuclease
VIVSCCVNRGDLCRSRNGALAIPTNSVTFIGVDLAWSPRNLTGAAVLRGDASGADLIDHDLLGDDAAISAYVVRHAGDGPAIVAVDAPLWVPNQNGRRPGEAEIGRAFGRYQAGAHPANRSRLAFDGVVRGEALVAALAAHGFVHASEVQAGVPVRQVIEVFPHSAMVALFGLDRTLKYKAKPRRSAELRLSEWRRYQNHLAALAGADPPLRGQSALIGQDVAALRGRRLKGYEDQVDALMCAYIALYGFRWGAARCRAFGTFEGGYIFSPLPEAMWPQ